MAATVDLMVSRIGPLLLLLMHHFGPMLDTIISIVAALGIENGKTVKVNRIPELETNSWTPPI